VALYDVPGVIEAEGFDEGGQHVGYRDFTTANQGHGVSDTLILTGQVFQTRRKNIGV